MRARRWLSATLAQDAILHAGGDRGVLVPYAIGKAVAAMPGADLEGLTVKVFWRSDVDAAAAGAAFRAATE